MTERVINLARDIYKDALASGENLGSLSEAGLRAVAHQAVDISFVLATVFELEASRRYHEMQENRPPLVADPGLR